MKESRLLPVIILVLVSFVIQSGLFLSRLESRINQRQTAFGELLARQLADAASPLMVGNDLVSLGMLAEQLTRHEDVDSVQIFNLQQQLVAQSGSVLSRGVQRVSYPVALENQPLGRVELVMHTYPLQEIASAEAASIGWIALIHGLLLTGLSLLIGRSPPPQTPTDSKGTPEVRPVTRLHFTIADSNSLLERVSPEVADEVFEWYETLATNAAHLHGGQVSGSLASGGLMVDFRQSDIVERQFHALLTTQLGFSLVDGCRAARERDGLLSFQLKAGICHGSETAASRLLTLGETLSRTAPAGGLLLDTEGMLPLLRLRSEVQQEVRLAIPELAEEHQVILISRLRPEYHQLVQRQAQQLTGATPLADTP